jgi:acetyl esterase/lipase
VVGGYPVYELKPRGGAPPRARILYLHGGAFLMEIVETAWHFARSLATGLNAVVTVPIYPLGPEHTVVEMYDMLQPLYNEMAAEQGTPFWVMGDSAGGTMALGLTQLAVRDGKTTADRAVLITPCVDSSFTNPEALRLSSSDPWLGLAGVKEATKMVAADLDIKDTRVSPLYGSLDGLPPMLVFVASTDMLTPDTKKLVSKAKEQGKDVELVEGEGMVHVWPVINFPEGKIARDQMIAWLEEPRP